MRTLRPQLASLLLLGMALAQRQVTVQEGPLYRTEGSHVTLWCKVSGYQGPAEQNFQWSIYLPSAPEREVQIVSTVDPSFPYAIYTQRVRSRGIFVERLQGDAVLLHITELQERDAGEYECHTPNTDERYFGSYSAKMNLVVIPDSLRVTAVPQTLSKVEHDSLELKCEVSKSTAQHSHVSIAWYRQRGSEAPVEVISLSRDFVLRAGSAYAQRQATGDVRLDKVGETTSKLTIYNLHPSDQGEFYCEAAEWIQDPDNSWYAMTRKRSQGAIVNVQATDKEFSVRLETEKRMYIVGEPVEFRCILEAQNIPDRYFSISWAFNSSLIASLGPNAVPVLNNEFAQREALGQLKVAKESDNVFVLKIYRLRLEDSGKYNCRVTEREKTVTGDFIDKESKRPKNIPITVMPLKAGFAVTAISRTPGVTYNESFDLQCIIKPHYPSWVPVSVTWRFQPAGSTEFHDLVTFTRDGGVQWGDRYAGFRTRTAIEKAESSNNVRLSISRASDTEAGKYQCVAELWRKNYNSSWTRLADRTSNLLEIRVLRPVTKLQVSKSKRSITLVENRPIPLNCSVKSQTSPDSHFAVLWYVHKPSDADGKLILKTTHSSAFEYGTYAEEEGLRGRLQFERSASGGLFSLTVQRAEVRDSGSYYCHVEEWLLSPNHAWYKLAEEVSGRTEVTVKQPDNRLQVNQTHKNITVLENEWVTLECLVSNRTSPSSQLSVEWSVWRPGRADKEVVAWLSRQSTLHYGEPAALGDLRSRLHLESPAPGLYLLSIQNSTVRDSGAYSCRVEEWLLDPSDRWYKRAEDLSGLITLTVKQPDPTLQVDTATANLTVQEKESFPLDCSILSRSSPESHFAVTWYSLRAKEAGDRAEEGEEEEEREAVLSVGPDAIFSPEAGRWEGRLRFQRLSAVLFRLTVLQAGGADTGNYSCRVEEWLADPNGLWYRLAEEESGVVAVHVQDAGSTLQSVICSNDALFYFVFFYPFPIFGILIITILLVRFKSRNSSKNSEGKNGVPLLWIKEPHLNYSPTCLEPPVLSIHPGTID
ncbi:immunoglobulin superfamily member 3 isoform X2 [Corvus cornix cornix]|uniref:immunoglobulin superfamily member 3 isoform X2 n=1 Tax=Corvus cornix cornix TaxID=932674 RepID=UPI0019516EEF|nr:immunoglobulin superfamily member 3 isoform X2 [Corvus cornix cornix]XP_041893817.1 immunoglobulin superfamily member 3 isoform X2 [Corvus kubaryi]XP_048149615.1 immunoglobulin superfamily member 3 isoform X2 [Corvus hawaiiensis]